MNIHRLFSKYFYWDLKYKISAFFNPRQKWLTKKIPRTYCDKPELIRDILFNCLENFVSEDGEDCFNVADWEWSEEKKESRRKLELAMDIIKVQIPAKQKELDDRWEADVSTTVSDFLERRLEDKKTCEIDGKTVTTYALKPLSPEQKERVEENWKLEQEILDLEQKALMIIIEERTGLWT